MVKIMFSETSEVTKNNGKEKPETKFSEKKKIGKFCMPLNIYGQFMRSPPFVLSGTGISRAIKKENSSELCIRGLKYAT